MTHSLSPRAARTRTSLIEAGLDLLAERPVDSISIDELVERAGVAKGSFFNHFSDKQSFADTIAFDIRQLLEDKVKRFNAGLLDPLKRLSGGMITAATFAVEEHHRSSVLIRTSTSMVLTIHPLNGGVVNDMRAAIASKQLGQIDEQAGVLFWLGCCQTLMTAIVASNANKQQVLPMVSNMLAISLRGLDVKSDEINSLMEWASNIALKQAEQNQLGRRLIMA